MKTIPRAATGLEIVAAIRKYIAENLLYVNGDPKIGNDDSLIDQGVVDSTGILSLMLFVEEEFGIEVRDEEVVPDNFDSVNSLASYIGRKQKSGK